MGWSKLVDMELDDDDKMDTIMPMPMSMPDYPCGLKICLTHVELEKLGLDADCDIGDVIDMRCFAEVTSVTKDGENQRVELQIQKLAIEDEMTEED